MISYQKSRNTHVCLGHKSEVGLSFFCNLHWLFQLCFHLMNNFSMGSFIGWWQYSVKYNTKTFKWPTKKQNGNLNLYLRQEEVPIRNPERKRKHVSSFSNDFSAWKRSRCCFEQSVKQGTVYHVSATVLIQYITIVSWFSQDMLFDVIIFLSSPVNVGLILSVMLTPAYLGSSLSTKSQRLDFGFTRHLHNNSSINDISIREGVFAVDGIVFDWEFFNGHFQMAKSGGKQKSVAKTKRKLKPVAPSAATLCRLYLLSSIQMLWNQFFLYHTPAQSSATKRFSAMETRRGLTWDYIMNDLRQSRHTLSG